MFAVSRHLFSKFPFLCLRIVIATAQNEGAGPARADARRGALLRTEVALRHAVVLPASGNGVKGADQLARSASHARFRMMEDRRSLFVPDHAPADAGFRAGRLNAMPAKGCPGCSLDQGQREPSGRFLSGNKIPRIRKAERLDLTGENTAEAHQTTLRPKNNRSFHRPLSSNPSSSSFSGVGQPVTRSHPLAV